MAEKTEKTEKVPENTVKKDYLAIQKKYSLPSLDNVENDFGYIDFDSERFMLSSVRRKMSDKIDAFAIGIANIFEGETNLTNLYESKVLDEDKKTELFNIYRKLMKHSRQANILSLYYDEKEEAEFVKDFYKEWQTIKKEIKKYFVMLRDSWNENHDLPEDIQNYLG